MHIRGLGTSGNIVALGPICASHDADDRQMSAYGSSGVRSLIGQSDFDWCEAPLSLNGRALRATLAQVRACSGVPADTISRAVPADMRRLLPSAPEPNPT